MPLVQVPLTMELLVQEQAVQQWVVETTCM
jgi:hypothetical protein